MFRRHTVGTELRRAFAAGVSGPRPQKEFALLIQNPSWLMIVYTNIWGIIVIQEQAASSGELGQVLFFSFLNGPC